MPKGRMRSKRRRPDDLPAMAPIRRSDVFRSKRLIGALQPLRLLEKPARSGRGIKEQHPGRLGARVLPGMSEPARHEGAGARTTDRDLLTDLEGDLASEHVGDLVAVVVQVISRPGVGRRRLLKHHYALAGLPAQELERRRPARCHLPHPSLTGRYHKTFCLHRSILPLRSKRPSPCYEPLAYLQGLIQRRPLNRAKSVSVEHKIYPLDCEDRQVGACCEVAGGPKALEFQPEAWQSAYSTAAQYAHAATSAKRAAAPLYAEPGAGAPPLCGW